MSDVERVPSQAAFVTSISVAVIGLLVGIGALVWCYGLQNHITAAETKLVAANKKSTDLNDQLEATNARLSATAETLGQDVGSTQKQIEVRAQSIMAAQKTANAQTAKLEEEQKVTAQKVGAVSTDVASVKTDVGGVKTDVATTKTDLEATKSQLSRVMGDAGVMSGLIATNHDELEQLKHKGDRNYYEFTLHKGEQPTLLSSVKLQLKKVDEKHSKYTMNVSADDKNIEKKDKNLDEPVQFYSGKTPMLFELVVNNVSKNQVSGYLSTPKGAPSGMTP